MKSEGKTCPGPNKMCLVLLGIKPKNDEFNLEKWNHEESEEKNHIPKELQVQGFLQILNVHESQKAEILKFYYIIDKNVQLFFNLSRKDYMILNTHLKIQKVNVLKRLVKRKIFI